MRELRDTTNLSDSCASLLSEQGGIVRRSKPLSSPFVLPTLPYGPRWRAIPTNEEVLRAFVVSLGWKSEAAHSVKDVYIERLKIRIAELENKKLNASKRK